jgi:hypothetical protein
MRYCREVDDRTGIAQSHLLVPSSPERGTQGAPDESRCTCDGNLQAVARGITLRDEIRSAGCTNRK